MEKDSERSREFMARRQNERTFVEQALGHSVICARCGCTLSNFAGVCDADLAEWCEGFDRIERARRDFAVQSEGR